MLATSLILCVVLTLLAVSAIRSASLGERMAGNQRQQLMALNAANSALRYVESRLASDELRARAIEGSVPAVPGDGSASRYFSEGFWSRDGVRVYQPADSDGASALEILYLVEVLGPEQQLREGLAAGKAGLTLRVRITARARGPSPAARAVVQSVYRIPL